MARLQRDVTIDFYWKSSNKAIVVKFLLWLKMLFDLFYRKLCIMWVRFLKEKITNIIMQLTTFSYVMNHICLFTSNNNSY